MSLFGRKRLSLAAICLLGIPLSGQTHQQTSPPAAPAQQSTDKTPQTQPDKNAVKPGLAAPAGQPTEPPAKSSPFEAVPPASEAPAAQQAPTPAGQVPSQAKPANPLETVPQTAEPEKPGVAVNADKSNVVVAIEIRGSRRVPQDTLRALMTTKRGDVFNQENLRRDFMALWNSNRFDDIRLEQEASPEGGIILRYIVTERPVIRTINYPGAKSVSTSDILDRFKERKVGLTVESQYDPAKVQRAAVVIKELLGEHGRQFATVTPELKSIPPNSLIVDFQIDEGAKVKVGKIDFTGNTVFSDKEVLRAMKNSKPLGIPYGLFTEFLFAKTYDSAKLEEDKERIRDAYQQKGYFYAKVLDQTVNIVDTPGKSFIPFKKAKPGKAANISLPIEEGKQMRLSKITYTGVKLFRTPDVLSKGLFAMEPNDVFSTAKLRKGLENMRKLYGEFGYIDFVPEPEIQPSSSNPGLLDLTITADEGKQFFVRRIEFAGNTTTRDKVIRRELLLDEGDVYSSRLWDASILRLNQLGYFEALKETESTDLKRDPKTNTVDITLKVKERGKNSIGLNGGVSGIAGTFIGANYQTNNFLGLGETLSISGQVGTRQDDISVGFTEPYLFDRPIQAGVTLYYRRFNYNQGREYSLLTGQNYIPYYNAIGAQNLLNYSQNSRGISFSVSHPIRRSFARVGLTFGYDNSSIDPQSTAATQYFQYLNFQGVSGPNSLEGIKTARITPSYSYSSKNSYLSPTAGKSIFASVDVAGSILGANVNTIRPSLDLQYYHRAPKFHRNTIAAHMLASMIAGYGGKVAPPYSRTYIGGEQDIRGFDFYSITPVAYLPSTSTANIYNNDGSLATQQVLVNGVKTTVSVTQPIPIYQVISPGGDTQLIGNLEYRIPIFNVITLAPFIDAGINKVVLTNQLKINESRVEQLNGLFPQANFSNQVRIAPGTQGLHMSTGLEVGVMLPVVQAPFRVYYAYNPFRTDLTLHTPIAADQSYFPNNLSFLNSLTAYGQSYPYIQKHSTFKFTIGRTF